jgi:hypothetical protein
MAAGVSRLTWETSFTTRRQSQDGIDQALEKQPSRSSHQPAIPKPSSNASRFAMKRNRRRQRRANSGHTFKSVSSAWLEARMIPAPAGSERKTSRSRSSRHSRSRQARSMWMRICAPRMIHPTSLAGRNVGFPEMVGDLPISRSAWMCGLASTFDKQTPEQAPGGCSFTFRRSASSSFRGRMVLRTG